MPRALLESPFKLVPTAIPGCNREEEQLIAVTYCMLPGEDVKLSALSDAHTISITVRATGFNALPPELLEAIQANIDDIRSHVSFSRVCSRTRRLYDDHRIFRDICLRQGFGRPRAFVKQSWRSIACAAVHHAEQCNHCRQCLKRLPSMLDDAPNVFAEPRAAPVVKLVSELRQSIGNYTLNWKEPQLNDRPGVSVLVYGSDSGDPALRASPRLLKHIAMASRLAFTVPLKKVRCGYEADDDWCFSGYALDMYRDSELGPAAPSALQYRTEAVNEDGLTCLDLLVAAGDVPGLPIAERTENALVYNGLLDDQIRQGVVWVQGRC